METPQTLTSIKNSKTQRDSAGDITLFVEYRGKEHVIKTHRYEYRSLMALLYDKFYFENFGDCKGVGRCGTCHVKIENSINGLSTKEGNEETTLSRMENVTENSRLSCQILVTEAIDQVRFIVADEGDLGLY